jgi:hypothetical protein
VKKIGFIFAMIILFAVFSVQAKQKTGIITAPPVRQQPSIQPAPTPEYDNAITLEDDATGTYLVISPLSGKYKYFQCNGGSPIALMSGTAKVRIDGCTIYVEDVQASHSVLATLNKCTQEGKAAIEQYSMKDRPYDVQVIKSYISDSNMRDNTLSCQTEKK